MLQYCSSEKKSVKLLKIALLRSYLGRNWASMGHTQNQAQFFFVEITKGDHKLSRTFYFIRISYVLTELWMIFCDMLSCVIFCCHFWQKNVCRNILSIPCSSYDSLKKWIDIFNCLYCKYQGCSLGYALLQSSPSTK